MKTCDTCRFSQEVAQPLANFTSSRRLNCVRDLGRMVTDGVETYGTMGATPCTLQRKTSWLLARLTGTCGQEGRFWEARTGEKHLSAPRRVRSVEEAPELAMLRGIEQCL